MRAVNLIPEELRPGGGVGSAGRSGGAAYLLLVALGALVLMTALWAQAGRGMASKRDQAAQLQTEAAQVQQRTAGLAAVSTDDSVAATRVASVKGLAAARVDWGRALDDLSRVLPRNAWLSTLTATVSPGVGGGSDSSGLRSALQVPALEITGCTTSQDQVARLMARLRTVPYVQRVTLGTSSKAGSAAGSGSGAGNCQADHPNYPSFSMVLFYDPIAGQPATTGTTTATAATTPPAGTATTSTTAAPASTPASTTTPAPAAPSTTGTGG